MFEMWIVARSQIRSSFKNRIIFFLPIIMLVSSISYVANYTSVIGAATAQGANSQGLVDVSRAYLNTVLFLWPLAYSLITNYLGSTMLVLEKTGHNLETLMVTPLNIRQLWIGKSLGLGIVSVIIGLSLSVLVFLGLSVGLVIPTTGVFVVPDALPIITALIISPILVFGVMLLATYFQFVVANPRTAAIVYIFIVMSVVLGMFIAILKVANFDYYPLIYLGLIAIVGIADYFASRSLTPEKVVLSSKG